MLDKLEGEGRINGSKKFCVNVSGLMKIAVLFSCSSGRDLEVVRGSCWLLVVLCLVCAAVFAEGSVLADKVDSTPDLLQTDPEGNLPGGGRQYCAPVAVSNSLIWLGENGYKNLVPRGMSRKKAQIEIARILGSKDCMNTNLEGGTGVSGVLRGVERYLNQHGYAYRRLEYQGWRRHPRKYSTRVEVPDLEWLKTGLAGDSGVWLNVGWYKYDNQTDEYCRIGGHWVTLVGYGVDEKGIKNAATLILHDPAPRAGRSFSDEYVRTEKIKSGTLTGEKWKLARSAAGYYKLTDGMHVRKQADFGILDGVVVLGM